MSVRQYMRQVRVTVGQSGEKGMSWTGLRVAAKVTKTKDKKPDKAEIQLYNLGETSLGLLQAEGAVIFLHAGYGDLPSLIFRGDIDSVEIGRDGRDRIATVEAADGRRKYQDSFVLETFKPPLHSSQLIRRLADLMGMAVGNLPATLPRVDYVQGYTLVGSARDALDEVTSSLGARWSIQDEEIVVTLDGEPLEQRAFLLSPSTGLVGQPEKVKEKGKTKGMKFRSLLNGGIKPKRLVRLESALVSGWFVPKEVVHTLDSGWSDDFFTEIDAEERKSA